MLRYCAEISRRARRPEPINQPRSANLLSGGDGTKPEVKNGEEKL